MATSIARSRALHNGLLYDRKSDTLDAGSMPNIDELYARWKQNPDADLTVAMCEALRGSNRDDLVGVIGDHASRQLEVPPLVAAAKMYVDLGRLEQAQNVLVSAGRLAPRDGEVFRLLGEIVLRRGDAIKAEKLLERAVQLEARDSKNWLTKARDLIMTQQVSGPSAVVKELARSKPPSAPPFETAPAVQDPMLRLDDLVQQQLQPQTGVNTQASPPRSPFHSSDAFGSSGTAHQGFTVAKTGQDAALPPSPPIVAPPVPPPARAKEPEIPMNPQLAEWVAKPQKAEGIPEARDVLEALQISGVYEPDGAVGPQAVAWDRAEKQESRGRKFAKVGLIAFVCLSIGGGIGTYFTVQSRRAVAHQEAEAMLAKVDSDLALADPKLLDPSEKALAKVFELESRSPHAALTWLRERAMVGLLKSGADLAFEDAVQRAKEVGVPESKVAFAHVASFLFQGDAAGAVATIAKHDAIAHDDAWFNLLAGATFERVGDARALERYALAAKLEPSLFVVKLLTIRAMAIDGDAHRAAELAKELRTQHPERAETAALVALAWARDPRRGDPPPELKEAEGKAGDLPISIRAVAHASRAILALEKHDIEDAKTALNKGLTVAETPGMASWLGNVALSTGDENLARKAALAAVSFSAVYPPARVLAARVALLGARLDEALKAIEDLPPQSPDVAIVSAAAAYEKLDGARMQAAFEPLSDDAKKFTIVLPLLRGQALMAGSFSGMTGEKLVASSDDDAPWADLVAIDAVLDGGDLDSAEKIAAPWRSDVRPLKAIRLARLARYQGKLEDADKYSETAVKTGTVTLRSLTERVYVLVATNRGHDAVAFMKTYPNVGGPIWKWLRAYAVASGGGKMDEARAIVAQEDAPPALAPIQARLIAASAYAAMKDTRKGNPYLQSILGAGFSNPDTAAAAEKLGLAKPGRRLR